MTSAPAPALAVPDPADDMAPAASTPKHHRVPRTRRVIAWILVVVVSVLVPLCVLTVWSVRTLTNTDRYVATVAPLVRQPAVTSYMAAAATDKLFSEVHVQQRIEKALPKRAEFIAGPVTTQLHTFTRTQATRLLQSEWFAKFWDAANRRIHTNLIKFLKGEPLPRVDKARHVAISLTPVVDKVVTKLDQRGVTVFDSARAKLDKGAAANFSLANNQQVKKIRSVFRAASSLGWKLPLAVLILLAVAVAVAVERRKTLLRAAVGSSIAVMVTLAGLAIGRNVFINAGNAPHDVTADVFDVVTRYLSNALRWVLLASVLIALLMWLVGPGRAPVWLRRTVWRAMCWIGREVAALFNSERRGHVTARGRSVAVWCLRYRSQLRLVGVGVAAVVILFGAALAVSSVWTTLLLLVVYLVLLELVFAWARRIRSSPAAGPVVATDAAPGPGTGGDVGAPDGDRTPVGAGGPSGAHDT